MTSSSSCVRTTLPHLLIPPLLLVAATALLTTSLITEYWVIYDNDQHEGVFDIDTSGDIEAVRVLLFFVVITYAVSFLVKLHFVFTHGKNDTSGRKAHAYRYLALCSVSTCLGVAAIGMFVNIKQNLPELCSFGYSFHLAWGSCVCVFVGGAYHFLWTTHDSRRAERRRRRQRVPSEMPLPMFNIQQHMSWPNPSNGNVMTNYGMNEAFLMNNLSMRNHQNPNIMINEPIMMNSATRSPIVMTQTNIMNRPNNQSPNTTNHNLNNPNVMNNQNMNNLYNNMACNNPIQHNTTMMNSPNSNSMNDQTTNNTNYIMDQNTNSTSMARHNLNYSNMINNPNHVPYGMNPYMMNFPFMMNIPNVRNINSGQSRTSPPRYDETSVVNNGANDPRSLNPPAYDEQANDDERPKNEEQANCTERIDIGGRSNDNGQNEEGRLTARNNTNISSTNL